MRPQIAETDWKVFKRVREQALDRFCRKVLEECESISRDETKTAHERYGTLYGHLQDRNREMAAAFDDFRCSTAVLCLIQFQRLGILTDEEIREFSPDVQRSLENAKNM